MHWIKTGMFSGGVQQEAVLRRNRRGVYAGCFTAFSMTRSAGVCGEVKRSIIVKFSAPSSSPACHPERSEGTEKHFFYIRCFTAFSMTRSAGVCGEVNRSIIVKSGVPPPSPACHPERSEGTEVHFLYQVLHCVQHDTFGRGLR